MEVRWETRGQHGRRVRGKSNAVSKSNSATEARSAGGRSSKNRLGSSATASQQAGCLTKRALGSELALIKKSGQLTSLSSPFTKRCMKTGLIFITLILLPSLFFGTCKWPETIYTLNVRPMALSFISNAAEKGWEEMRPVGRSRLTTEGKWVIQPKCRVRWQWHRHAATLR